MASVNDIQRPPRRTQAHRRETAEAALLDAALSLISVRGVKGTTLGEVGEAAGYSKGIAAHYFKTKDRMLQAAAEYVNEVYAQLLVETSAKPGLETLMRFVEMSCAPLRLELSRAIYLMQKEAFFNTSGLADVFRKYNKRAVKRLESEIRAGIANGEIRKDADPKAEAIVLLALTRGLRTQWILAPDKLNLLKMKTEMADFVRTNLSPKRGH
ncbi:TetR/AcrR family transcriptional regulator [Bradyrhizobium vignae]|uniref:TetR/AcrR family transcriptional regulator n=1 Tax=Bradyrhizobium vignae TaxID=1549949 RepID=UPI00100B7538|nr:TetR/AcrR family transcriptional regulator [Bradyrhizobium vignae]RXH06672.1 TetR/AcrR family transcriptional regulator [Bradyrhizobium vignae]